MTKRVTLFAGHYGSGKTTLAVNYALWLRSQGHKVIVADLDIVNPYFRTKDSEDELAEAGIELIASPFANSNVDLPALPGAIYRVTEDRSSYAVMDVGGDDRGALALGRYSPALREEDNYEMLFVFNGFRPMTPTAEDALKVLREVEAAGKLPFTGIVHNSNLGPETTAGDIISRMPEAEKLARISGLPLFATAAPDHLDPASLPDDIMLLKLTGRHY